MSHVLYFMVRHASQPNTHEADIGYRVEAPRMSDAIGVVLRDSYERDLGIPDDMANLLRQMNGHISQDN